MPPRNEDACSGVPVPRDWQHARHVPSAAEGDTGQREVGRGRLPFNWTPDCRRRPHMVLIRPTEPGAFVTGLGQLQMVQIPGLPRSCVGELLCRAVDDQNQNGREGRDGGRLQRASRAVYRASQP